MNIFDGMPLLDAILNIYNTFDAFNFGGAKPNARLPTFPIIRHHASSFIHGTILH